MTRRCTVCTHVEKARIDEKLVDGASYRDIARQYSLSKDSVHRHNQSHIPQKLKDDQKAQELTQAGSLLNQMLYLQSRALSILKVAESSGQLKTALIAIGQARANLEMLGRLGGQLAQAPQVSVELKQLFISEPVMLEVAQYGKELVENQRKLVELAEAQKMNKEKGQ